MGNSKKRFGVLGWFLLLWLSACAEKPGGGGIQIELRKQAPLLDFFRQVKAKFGGDRATPSSLSDFGCYLVQVTAPGLKGGDPLDSRCAFMSSATITTGEFSKILAEGKTIEMGITRGKDRVFSVYGVHAASNNCELDTSTLENLHLYRVGTTTADVKSAGTISIPVEWTPGTLRNLVCKQATPGSFTVSATAGNGQVSLSWTDSEGALSYLLEYGSSSGTYTHSIAVTGTSQVVTNLTNGILQYFRVSAINQADTKLASEVSATPVDPPGAFSVTATPGDTQVTLNWGTSSDAVDYQVQFRKGSDNFANFGSPTTNTSATVTTLLNNTSYDFKVIATNPSGTALATVSATPNPPPAAFSVTATPGETQVILNWGTSAGAVDYQVQFRTGSASFANFGSPTTGTTATVTGLTNNTSYDFKVIATNPSGTAVATVTATPKPPPAAFSVTASPGDTQVTLNWGTSAGAVYYQVQFRTGSSSFANFGSPTTGTTATVTGLTNNTSYDFKVIATNPSGTAVATVTATPKPPPAAFSVTATPGDTQVTLNWGTSTGAVDYQVQFRTGSASFANFGSPTTGTTATVTGLTNNTSYDFKVIATNPSGTAVATVSSTPNPPPGAFSVTATPGDTQVTLNWGTSSDAVDYQVQFRTGSASFANFGSPTTGTTATVTGITNNLSYDFKVIATNPSGTAVATVSATPTSGGSAPGAFSITATTASDSQVGLVWSTSTGATSYDVKRSTTTGGPYTLSATLAAPASTTPVTRLVNGTSYFFIVTAKNANGSTNSTNEPNATPSSLGGSLSSFLISSVTPLSNGVMATWDTSSTASTYELLWGPASQIYTANSSPAGGTTTSIATLESGVLAYLSVRASDGTNYRFSSNELTALPTAWTWKAGDTSINVAGVYSGTMKPGGRRGSRAVPLTSKMILFGGYGRDGAGAQGYLNDIWEFDEATRSWNFRKGGSVVDQYATYGTLGSASPSNVPGARHSGATWTDGVGGIWLFGGYGLTTLSVAAGHLNDIWSYDNTTTDWTWQGGSTAPDQVGVYTSLGLSPTNQPGGRKGMTAWSASATRYCFFGGYGNGKGSRAARIGYLNDLWCFEKTVSSGDWSWISGSNDVDQLGTYGTQGAASASNVPGAREGAISWKVGSHVWIFGGYGFGEASFAGHLNDLWKFDGTQWTWVKGSKATNQAGVYGTAGVAASGNTPGARREAVGWIGDDGNLWLFGGDGYNASTLGSLGDLWKYDITLNQWIWVDGFETLNGVGSYGALNLAGASNTPGARQNATAWYSTAGSPPSPTFWLFGGNGYGGGGSTAGDLNDLWAFPRLNAGASSRKNGGHRRSSPQAGTRNP